VPLAGAALQVDELREAIAELHEEAADPRLQDAYNEVEHLETRLHDEARALHVFDDEYECSCGSCDEPRPLPEASSAEVPQPQCACAEGASFEDEEQRPAAPRPARWGLKELLRGMAAGAALAAFAALISTQTDEG
jgi:hypothetical protein